ncbi:MAG: hypothetical protein PHP51_02620 [Desulfotomaculaceae bacterium]|nr:hypothetical protein [Desulfotomaculaceae bacterium]MDD4767623.1 hypothetical protein [Desulfotomaculaceae bacterium]
MTNRESQIYNAIRKYIAINGYAPTLREIGQDVGLSPVSTVHHYLNRIMSKGYITYKPNQPRTLRVLKVMAGSDSELQTRVDTGF